jgi:signal transduction histidine kinase
MQPAIGVEYKARRSQSLSPRQMGVRLAIILGLTIIFIVTFDPITQRAGPVGAALISLPIALAGWYFGINAGLVAGCLGIALSSGLLTLFDGGTWFDWTFVYWPGNLMVIVVGLIAGYVRKELTGREQVVNELRFRERYLTLVNITTRDLLGSQNIDNRNSDLINHLLNLFVADYGYLIHWDAVWERAILSSSTIPMEQLFSNVVLEAGESELTLSTLESGHPLPIDDVPNSHYIVNPSIFGQLSLPTQSALAIPLKLKEHKLGVVVIAYDTPHHFTTVEIDHAEWAADQIALALWTFEQDLEIRKRLKETNTLVNIERALTETERVGSGTILQLIADSAKELIPGAEYVVLHLLDADDEVLVPRAVAGLKEPTSSNLRMHVGKGVAGQVVATGEIISVPDIQNDPRFLYETPPKGYRSLIVAPIQSNVRCVGTISVQNEHPNAFTPDEGRLLGVLGTQAAIAIENANLLQTTQQGLKEINALYQVSRGLAGSLDPDQLLGNVVDLLQKNFGYYHVQVFLLDTQLGELVARYGSGKIGDFLREQEYRLPVGSGIVGHVAETGEPFMTNDVERVVFFIRHPLLPETQSKITVPIKIENEVVGVLDIQQMPPDRLTTHDMQLMTAVADQLAVALQKANLYNELQTSLRQERLTHDQLIQSERLAVIGRLLASVSHELNNPLQAIQNALFLVKDEEELSAQGRNDLELVLSETERMADMIKRLRAFYRPSRAEDFQDIQLNNITVDVSALTANHMRHKNITYEFIPDLELPEVPGIPDQIRQIVLNLFMNAVEAMQAGGHLTVFTRRLPEEDRILFSVTDTGPGIAPEIISQIFEPFITNKENGTGLGLTITADIIRQHHGEIKAENNPGCGATFSVWLPKKRKE